MPIGFSNCSRSNAKENKGEESAVAQKVADLMATMSLEDKIGEMTQMAIDVLCVGEPYSLEEPHRLDSAKLRKVLVDLKVGSILNCGGHEYSKETWQGFISTIQRIATTEKTSQIPVIYGIDAIHGTNYTAGATLFPQQIALAATWNPNLATEMGKVTAYETRASFMPWNFSPVLDIGRDPRWSRHWETFGEDVHLATEMGNALMKGYEGNDISNPYQVAACLKHFLGYSNPKSGKDRTEAWIPERQLREYFLPTFKKAIESGAHTIMINSGEINGIPVHCNSEILTDLLRNELNFQGFVVSDWEDIKYLFSRHKVAKDHKEAIKMAINAGLDMSMVPMDLEFPVLLKELVEEGEVPISRINESVERILKVKVELGLFENSYYSNEKYPDFGSEKHRLVSLNAALEAITLLKNQDKILPLSKNQKVLVTGPTANNLNYLNGGWSHTWQGDKPEFNTPNKQTILQAIQNKIGKENVNYVEGTSIEKNINIKKAAEEAQKANVAIVCLGEATYTEKPGDIDDLNLPEAQRKLVDEIAKTNTPIILVLVEGRPRIISQFEEKTKAIIMGYLPGNEGGIAISDVLFGDYNPSGKLPFTYPRFANDLIPYDHKGTARIDKNFGENAFNPQFEFGFGLSYTNFKYSNLKINQEILTAKNTLEISVDVKNIGDRAGKEVIQLFIKDEVASVTPPVKRLRGFEKIELQPKEVKTIKFEIKASDLAFVGRENKWITEEGDFEIQIENLKQKFSYQKSVN